MPKVNPLEVLEGWTNYLSKSEVSEKVALERAKVCAECPNLESKVMLKVFKDSELKEIEGTRCGICKCPTSALIRTLSKSCSDNPPRWLKIN